MKKISTKDMARTAMIAALYFVISVAFLPLAFGAVQARVSEALTLLPVITPLGIWGATLGCAITNGYGTVVGANILGAADVVIGTSATFIAAVLSRALRRFRVMGLPIASVVPPVVINALVIGGELTFAETGGLSNLPVLWFNIVQVGLGQTLSCGVIGLAMVWALEQGGLSHRLFE